jgi:hypothetical protein
MTTSYGLYPDFKNCIKVKERISETGVAQPQYIIINIMFMKD